MASVLNYRSLQNLIFAMVICTLTQDACLAAKGGNGGGKPGGDPLTLPNVRYRVTPVSTPGQVNTTDHNNSGALVGVTSIGEGSANRRGFAYLPGISSSEGFYLDDPALGVANIPTGWHSRTAIGINNQGSIVGNLEPFDESQTGRTLPFVIRDVYATAPQMEVLGPFDSSAEKEAALVINDSGDMVVVSQRPTAGSGLDRLFVGNLAAYDVDGAASFTEVDFASQGIFSPEISINILDLPKLTERNGSGPAILAGEVRDGDQDWIFRTAVDGSSFEKLFFGEPLFEDSEGVHSVYNLAYASDVGPTGDVLLQVSVESRKGKGRNRRYAAIWQAGDSAVVPVPGANEVGASEAFTNSDEDFLLRGGASHLWHGNWSVDNGPIAIADLIDPNDPNAALFEAGWMRALTDRDATTGWPTLVSDGNYIAVLRPQIVGNAAVIATVPEPATAMLTIVALMASAPLTRLRRSCRRRI